MLELKPKQRHNSSYKDAQSFKQSAEANIDISSINHQYKLHICSEQQHLSFDDEFTRNQLRAAAFHPTIGQLAHQSLSNAATPELGMIPPK